MYVQVHYTSGHMTPKRVYGYIEMGVLIVFIVQHKNNTVHATHDAYVGPKHPPSFLSTDAQAIQKKTSFRTADHGWRVW